MKKRTEGSHQTVEDIILDNTDIISYHFYGDYNTHVRLIKRLKEEGRPIINTEWLGRIFNNDVFSLFPLFYMEKIGCYNWGFVAGKYQTYEPWEAPGNPMTKESWRMWISRNGSMTFTVRAITPMTRRKLN